VTLILLWALWVFALFYAIFGPKPDFFKNNDNDNDS